MRHLHLLIYGARYIPFQSSSAPEGGCDGPVSSRKSRYRVQNTPTNAGPQGERMGEKGRFRVIGAGGRARTVRGKPARFGFAHHRMRGSSKSR